jgi:TPR repeat protein
MRLFVFLAGAIFVLLTSISPSIAQSDIFAGKWRTDWGPAEVVRDGSGFRGTYTAEDGNADNDGTFVLTNKGKTWTGFWAEPDSNARCDTKRFGTYYWGRLKLGSAFSESGFDMNWGYCDFSEPDRLWVFNIKTGNAKVADEVPVYKASSVIKRLKSGFWEGAVKSNSRGLASYCFLSAQKQDEEFTIQLYWNSDGFHVLIFSDTWSLIEGDEFQGRVRIDSKFDGLVDASIFDSESIDYKFGFNKKARKAFQRGSRISLEGPLGKKSFQLNGTRKAVNVLQECAEEYLPAGDGPIASNVPTYEKGLAAYKNKDFAGALANWRPLAEQGDARLQSYVGEMYRDGEGVEQDYSEAVRWFKLAADQGSDRAQNSLGLRYYNGQGVTTDLKKAAYWFKAAAKQGNATAQNNLGEMHRDGEGVAQNTNKAAFWFRKAAAQGNASGQKNLDAILASDEPSVVILTDEADDIGKPFTLNILGDNLNANGDTILHPRDQIEIMFTAVGDLNRYSWIGLVAGDAVQVPEPERLTSLGTLNNRPDGKMTLTIPNYLGEFRLWMYDEKNKIALVDLPIRIELDTDSAALEVPQGRKLEPGQEFDVDFTASPNFDRNTWVGIVGADTPLDTSEEQTADRGASTRLIHRTEGRLTFTAPKKPGKYLLRMQEGWFKKTLTEVELTVVTLGSAPLVALPTNPSAGSGENPATALEDETTATIDQVIALLEGTSTSDQKTKALEKVAAALEEGDRRALLLMSLMLENGIGGPVDKEKARDYLDQAADALLPEALYQRALLTAETDPQAALLDIRMAAAEGYIPALQVYATLDYWENGSLDAGTATPPPPKIAKGDLIAIQAMLNSLGYQAGPPLGDLTDETMAAIRSFQENEGLLVDGAATGELRDQLVQALEGGN